MKVPTAVESISVGSAKVATGVESISMGSVMVATGVVVSPGKSDLVVY